jgi:gliding motility-associated-like protein/uncharacterized repeat protein (TIGR01451 family)
MEIPNLHKSRFVFDLLFNRKKTLFFIGFFVVSFLGFSQSTVVVTAIDAIATEETPATNTGVFEIDLGSINNTGGTISLNFVIGGTATAGIDYDNLGNNILIANGARRAQLVVIPINDLSQEGNESVTIRLISTNNAGFIIAGNSSSNASITIVDNDICSSGPNSPQLINNIETQYCSGFEVDLSSIVSSQTPPGTTLRWSTNRNPNPNNPSSFLPSSIITTGDDFYGFYYGTFNGNPCRSPVVELPRINFETRPSLGIVNNNNQACNQAAFTNTIIDLDETLTGETPGGTWNLTASPSGGASPIDPDNNVNYIGLPVGAYVYTYTPNYAAAQSCPDDSIEVTVFVSECNANCLAGNRPPELNTNIATTYCVEGDNNNFPVDLSIYTSSTAPSGSELIWSRSNDYTRQDAYINGSIIQQTGTYYAFFLDRANNCASPALAVSIILKTNPEILSFIENTLCTEGIMTLSATATPGSVINWFSSPTSITPLAQNSPSFTSPNLTTTTTYYVEADLDGCTSVRQPVIATINNQPIVQAIANPIEACNITGANFPNVIDLFSGLTQVASGTWAITTSLSNTLAITNSSSVNFTGAPVGNYTFTFTTNTAVAPCTNTSVTISVRVNACIIDSDNDGLSDDNEIAIGTNPNNPDSDADGILDDVEVGNDIANPLDGDGDGIIDALDSNILDTDGDGVVDQLDPANTNPCIPDNTIGLCDTDGDGISDGTEIANGSDPLDPCDPNLTPSCAPDPIDLQIVKTVDVLKPTVDDEITFTITLTNLSLNRAINIVINELLTTARGFEYVSHTVTNGLYNEATGVWAIPEMQGNEEYTLTIIARVLAFGDYINTAEIIDSFPRDATVENNISSITLDIFRRNTQDCGFLFNQFSPNNDGVNDFLVINCIQNYPNNTLEIFDRYGNQVYKAAAYNNSWDGRGKNGDAPKGTYYYILDLGDGSDIEKGWIQIIR